MSQRNERSMQPELDHVTHWLIRHAARLAPDSLSSRLEEEWLADSESRSSALSRLRFSVGCCWASAVIVCEFPRTAVPAAIPAATARAFSSVADRNFGYFSLRSGTLFLIVGIHAVVFCGLLTTLSHSRGVATAPNSQDHVLNSVPPAIEMSDFLAVK